MSRTSKDVYIELCELLQYCESINCVPLFDGKTVEFAMDEVPKAIIAIANNIEMPAYKRVQLISEFIEGSLGADDSCGATSGVVCSLLTSTPMRDLSDGYMPWSEIFSDLVCKEDDEYPMILRIEVARKTSDDTYRGSHSYTVLAHNRDELNMLQAYVGKYTLAEFLASDKSARVDALGLEQHFVLLSELESKSSLTRSKAYDELFVDGEFGSHHPEYRVHCKLATLNPDEASDNLAALRAHIDTEIMKNPGLETDGFENYVINRLHDRCIALFDTVDHPAEAMSVLESYFAEHSHYAEYKPICVT